jgi:hypothetical protein
MKPAFLRAYLTSILSASSSASLQGVAGIIKRANLRLRLSFLANYIQTMVTFRLNYY